jgi:catechol 2,3-dioxygenase-like lactoylglutathione lyase family enzyme
MFDHVSLRVRDFSKCLRSYSLALEPLGFVAQNVDEKGKSAGFGPPGEVRLWLGASDAAPSSVHLAFAAKSRSAVKKFHAAALEAGGKDHGEPGLRKDYSPTYYAAFAIDPDGNNVEAVTFAEK